MNLPKRILFVGAHCDDIELFAGGVLSKACRTGHQVGVLVFSDHRGIVSESQANAAKLEFQANLNWLRTEYSAKIEDHTDILLPACNGHFESQRHQIYRALEALREHYDLVITHSATDTNQDHQQVAIEAARVVKAHCSLWAGEFPNNDLGDFSANVYVPLSAEDVSAKNKMTSGYPSQQFNDRPYFDPKVITALATVRGAQIRVPAAEAFVAIRVKYS